MDRSAMACSLTIHLTVDNTQLWIQGEVIPNTATGIVFHGILYVRKKHGPLLCSES